MSKKRSTKRRVSIALAVLAALAMVLALSACSDGKTKSQERAQKVTEKYQEAAENAVPYPLEEVKSGGFLERTLLVENLLRQNDKSRIAYVTLLTYQGQPIAEYVIQGMVFSLNSQLTTEDAVADCGENCAVTSASPGDNGTWGPEPDGIGFFTTSGVEIKWNGLYVESDAPQHIVAKPVIVYDANAKPSVSAGRVGAITP